MKKTFWFALLTIGLLISGITSFQVIFTLPDKPQLNILANNQSELSLQCYKGSQSAHLDQNQQIDLLIWNVYKQNRPTLVSELTRLAKSKQLVLIQEANLTTELKEWIAEQGWFGNQVEAFKAFDTAAGVLNLSLATPTLACAYTELEPWLQLPKSAIYARYPLSNGETLAVVNIHAVNFTYGTVEYQRQLNVLIDELVAHQGPVIVAGDFNSWSEERLGVMKQALRKVGVKSASYSPDNRTQFITGLPLDHLFYRGLELIKAEAPISDASDHNPIIASFKL